MGMQVVDVVAGLLTVELVEGPFEEVTPVDVGTMRVTVLLGTGDGERVVPPVTVEDEDWVPGDSEVE